MTPMQAPMFGPDPWWVVLIKVVVVFVMLLTWTLFNVWFERRVLGKMQNRKGPIMNGPLGLGQTLADGVKMLFKEDFRPARTDAVLFTLAPMLIVVTAFTMWTVIPLGGDVTIFGFTTRLQITDFPVAVLFVLAIASIGVYGIVLAGWSSNGTYSLLGAMRSTAQLISCEIAMGLSFVAVFMYANSMSTHEIVEAQAAPINLFGTQTPFPGWYAALLFPSFITYVIAMFGETNRLPFDLAECESELVSGHLTDYSGFRYALYFMAEYINMVTVSAIATTLFLGGYRAPWPLNGTLVDQGWWGLWWFLLKVQLLFFFFSWVRASLPRFRYDQFMALGWKWLIPINMTWIALITVFRGGAAGGWLTTPMVIGLVGGVVLLVVALILLAERKEPVESISLVTDDGEFDAFAGGYPVPPLPGQIVPGLTAEVLIGTAGPDEAFMAAEARPGRASTRGEAD